MHFLCGLCASAVNILAGLRWNLASVLSRPNLDNSCGAVPLDRAGRPRPALVRNQAKPDQGVGLRARAPAPQDPCVYRIRPLRRHDFKDLQAWRR